MKMLPEQLSRICFLYLAIFCRESTLEIRLGMTTPPAKLIALHGATICSISPSLRWRCISTGELRTIFIRSNVLNGCYGLNAEKLFSDFKKNIFIKPSKTRYAAWIKPPFISRPVVLSRALFQQHFINISYCFFTPVGF